MEEKQQTQSNISLATILTISTVTIVIVGILKSMLYYALFGLNILPYLETSELTLLFLNDSLTVALSALFGMFVGYQLLEYHKKTSPLNTSSTPFKHPVFKTYSFLLIFLIALQFTLYNLETAIYRAVWHLLIYTLLLLFYTKMMREFILNLIGNTTQFKTVRISFALFFIVLLTIYQSGLKAIDKKYEKNKFKLQVSFNDSTTIRTTDTLIYLGQTQKFILFYDKVTGTKTIYPRDGISKWAVD